MGTVAYEELLKQDGQVMTHVVGSSMLPLLYDRKSIVIVEAADRIPPKKGDVVLYKTENIYILHRILQIQKEEYLIRGDNTWIIEHVQKHALLATMTGFYRKPEGKLITRNNPIYRIYICLIPGIRFGRKVGSRIKQIVHKLLIGKKTNS